MNHSLTHRKATINDLRSIIELLVEDELGQTREQLSDTLDERYIKAFNQISNDPNQYLMVVDLNDKIVGTCHLTIIPSLTFQGSTRLLIEAVRVSSAHRGKKIGEWVMKQTVQFGESNGASIMQLTTNKKRADAKRFYERLGFNATHEGMKLYLKESL